MVKCASCRQRKAKRACPALGAEICSLCCGRLRQKELRCPPGCSFLAGHKLYQENKIIQKKGTIRELAQTDERLNWLALNTEVPLRDYADRNPGFTDRDAILALEYARDKLEKNRPRLVLPKEEGGAKNELGEMVLQGLEQCRFQRKIILLQDMERYSLEEKLKCLDSLIQGIKYVGRAGLSGRTYLQDLARRLDRLKEFTDQKKIITRV